MSVSRQQAGRQAGRKTGKAVRAPHPHLRHHYIALHARYTSIVNIHIYLMALFLPYIP